MVKIWFGAAISLLASHGQAACSDIFQFGRPTVQLCIGSTCETAKMSRICGNVQALGENYEAETVLWIFRQRLHDEKSDADDEFAVLHDPLDPKDIPPRIVDGRPMRLLYSGVPVDQSIVRRVTCIPESSPDACDFINTVLENLREP